MQEVAIKTPDIQLDQMLKLAGAVMTGGEVRALIEAGRIEVNGQEETARRRKLRLGDTVTLRRPQGAEVYRVVPRK